MAIGGPTLSGQAASKEKLEALLQQLNPSQQALLGSRAKETLLGGGFGAGKTVGGCVKGILVSIQYPNTTGLVAMYSYPRLQDTVVNSWLEWAPPELAGKGYVKTDGPGGTYYFANGSKVLFRHFDEMSEDEIKSMNLGWAFIDQAEQVPEKSYLILLSRLRQQTVPKTQVWLSANPAPGWLKRRFIDADAEELAKKDIKVLNVTTLENEENLPNDYLETMRQTYSDAWFKRYVLSEWEAFEGLVYSDFSRERHTTEPLEHIPRDWTRTLVLDYGLRNPTHVSAFVTDYDGNHYLIREYRANDKSVPEYTQEILTHFADLFPFQGGMWADPSIKAKREKDRPTVQELFTRSGLPLSLANNDFNQAWALVTAWLKRGNLRVYESCQETIREFQNWMWDDYSHLQDRNLKETPIDRDNHAMDCLTYYANLHPESITERKPVNFMSELQRTQHIDPGVARQAKDEEIRDYFLHKRGKRQGVAY